MCNIPVILPLTLAMLAQAQDATDLDLVDQITYKFIDKLLDRALEGSSFRFEDADDTTLGKPGSVAVPSAQRSMASVLAIPRYATPGIPRATPVSAASNQFQRVNGAPFGRSQHPGRSLQSLSARQIQTFVATPASDAVQTAALAADDKATITKILAREVLDSRGNPTVEATLTTGYGTFQASAPSGASTGAYEALELRDGGSRYMGKGAEKAVSNVNDVIAPELLGKDSRLLGMLDTLMVEKLDGSSNEWGWSKAKLGANAILAVSMCLARAGAAAFGLELYEYIAELKLSNVDSSAVDVSRAKARKYKMPVPMMNVINGGEHAGNVLPMQEFMISPTGATTFKQAMQLGSEVYHSLKKVVTKRYGKDAASVGDEGGFAPNIQDEDSAREALDALTEAIKASGHTQEVKLAMDVAATEFFTKEEGTYNLGFKIDNPPASLIKTRADMIEFYKGIAKEYPIVSIEDAFDEDDFDAWTEITKDIGKDVQIVGDDLLVTNVKRIEFCKEKKAANAMLLKINQIGTITESIRAYLSSTAEGWGVMVSHRSGETEDTFIADMAVGLGTGQIKSGAPCRSERVCKYNRLIRIEEGLGSNSFYAGADFRNS
jgi:enolase